MSLDTNLKVLIVDDYKTMLRVMRGLFSQIGVQDVEEALDARAALEMVDLGKFGLIVCDWNMEPMTGLDMLKAERAHADPLVARTPFIMVAAESKMERIVAAKEAGVSNFIVKPFSAETLRSKVEGMAGGHAA